MKTKMIITFSLLGIITLTSVAQNNSFDYFGQTPPGDSAVVFAPGLISLKGRFEGGLVFSPAGNELCLNVVSSFNGNNPFWPGSVILYSKKTGSTWSKLDTAYFAPKSSFDVNFSPDGQLITFVVQGNADDWGNIYYCNRTNKGWSQPQPFPKVINSKSREAGHALTLNQTLYFSTGYFNPSGIGCDVACSRYVNGKYDSAVYVPNLSTIYDEDCIWVSPDESYAIIESGTGIGIKYLWISFHKKDGSWTPRKNMGPKINVQNKSQNRGSVSPDGKYLFFSGERGENNERDIYWIRVDKIIDDLKKEVFNTEITK